MHNLLTFAQDAVLAAEAGVDGILLSNHGGECVGIDDDRRPLIP